MSQTVENKILLYNAEKLGLKDLSVVKKAEEFLRVLQSKGDVKSVNDVAKTILCLDLAATQLSIGFDKETAFKLTGLRRTVYQNNFNNIQKILNLDKPVTISELCVQLSCTAAKEIAENILANYSESDKKIKDISHPQYVAAAIYTACNIKNIKVQKSQLIAVSRLKRAQWTELLNEFEKFAETLGLTKQKVGRSRKNDNKLSQDIDEMVKSRENNVTKMEVEDENIVEDYEVWRERILREANLKLLQNAAE